MEALFVVGLIIGIFLILVLVSVRYRDEPASVIRDTRSPAERELDEELARIMEIEVHPLAIDSKLRAMHDEMERNLEHYKRGLRSKWSTDDD